MGTSISCWVVSDGYGEILVQEIMRQQIGTSTTEFVELFIECHVVLRTSDHCMCSKRWKPVFRVSVWFIVIVQSPECSVGADEIAMNIADCFVFWNFLKESKVATVL